MSGLRRLVLVAHAGRGVVLLVLRAAGNAVGPAHDRDRQHKVEDDHRAGAALVGWHAGVGTYARVTGCPIGANLSALAPRKTKLVGREPALRGREGGVCWRPNPGIGARLPTLESGRTHSPWVGVLR